MVDRTQFATRDAASALEVLESYFPRVRMSRPRDEFQLQLDNRDAGAFSVLDYRLTCPRSSSAATMAGVVAIGQVTDGGIALDSGRTAINTARPWIFPETEVVAHWDDVGIKVLSIAEADLARYAARTSGRPVDRVTFHASGPRSVQLGEQWRALTTYVTLGLQPGGTLVGSPLATASAFAHLASVLLATFPNSTHDRVDRPVVIGNRSLQRALAHIDDNAHLPVTVDDIAAAAGVSLRALQYSFRSTLGCTPHERLRRVRLARAHEALLTADPATATVKTIATAWGFAHLGRFARLYHERYGVRPAETLRRQD